MAVLRAADLLSLRITFRNLRPDRVAGQPARLVRLDASAPALMVFELPPQHIAERAFAEDESGSLGDLLPPPVPAALADPSRLVFRLPASMQSIPFTLDALLKWSDYEPVVPANAQPDPPSPSGRPRPTPPSATETAIEVPYGLILCPDASAGWAHASTVVPRNGRTELWHTRLGVKTGSGVNEQRRPALRAVANTHTTRLLADFMRGGIGEPLGSDRRATIAHATSDFSLDVQQVVLNGGFPTPVTFPYTPSPLVANRLVLSALGAWTDLSANFPRNSDDPLAPMFPDAVTGIAAWRHIVSMGRDQYVRIVTRGYLLPLGLPAVVTQTTQRRFKPLDNGDIAGCLAQSTCIVVQQPSRRLDTEALRSHGFQHGGREMPLRSVQMASSMITVPGALQDTDRFFPRDVDGNVVRFAVDAEDAAGNALGFGLPMMFVSERAAQDVAGTLQAYRAQPAELRRADLRGQMMALAPTGGDNTRFSTFSIDFDAAAAGADVAGPSESRFLPTLAAAGVAIPALDALFPTAGTNAVRSVSYHAAYLRNAFDAATNPGQVVLSLIPFAIDPPRAQSGALCAFPMQLDGISQRFGPVAAVNDIARGAFDPARIFRAIDARLLGAIDLKDLLLSIAPGAAGLDRQVPKMLQVRDRTSVKTTLDWNPSVKTLQGVIETTSATTLSLHAETTVFLDGREPVFDVTGTLSRFRFSLLELVAISFGDIVFRVQDRRRTTLNAHGVKVEFLHKLSFVKNLGDVLPADGFDGARLAVDQDGVTASYTLGIPSAGAGAFSIENIALSAALFLPFGDRPTDLRLAFSSREHPFLVTFSMVGGGGFFAVVLNAKRITLIEGAFELGGNISFDFFVARASLHALAGFYFSMPSDGPLTLSAFVRVGGEVEVLGIIGVSVDVYVALDYSPSPGRLGVMRGDAGLTLSVHLLMFSKSVTLGLSCSFDIATGHIDVSQRSFARLLSNDDWFEYCSAFA